MFGFTSGEAQPRRGPSGAKAKENAGSKTVKDHDEDLADLLEEQRPNARNDASGVTKASKMMMSEQETTPTSTPSSSTSSSPSAGDASSSRSSPFDENNGPEDVPLLPVTAASRPPMEPCMGMEDDDSDSVQKKYRRRNSQFIPCPPALSRFLQRVSQCMTLFCHLHPWLSACTALALMLSMVVLLESLVFNPVLKTGVVSHYDHLTHARSKYDLTLKDIDHWCLAGDNDSCQCDDPLLPVSRGERGSWVQAFQENRNKVKSYEKDNSLDVAIVGASVVEMMDGHWMGRTRSLELRNLSALFASHFDKNHKPGAHFQGVALGIAGDTAPNVLWRLMHGEMTSDFNPKVWWISLGSNELSIQHCSEEVVIMGILRVVEEILERKPNARVVINSLLPMATWRNSKSMNRDSDADLYPTISDYRDSLGSQNGSGIKRKKALKPEKITREEKKLKRIANKSDGQQTTVQSDGEQTAVLSDVAVDAPTKKMGGKKKSTDKKLSPSGRRLMEEDDYGIDQTERVRKGMMKARKNENIGRERTAKEEQQAEERRKRIRERLEERKKERLEKKLDNVYGTNGVDTLPVDQVEKEERLRDWKEHKGMMNNQMKNKPFREDKKVVSRVNPILTDKAQIRKYQPGLLHTKRTPVPVWPSVKVINRALRDFAQQNSDRVYYFDATELFAKRIVVMEKKAGEDTYTQRAGPYHLLSDRISPKGNPTLLGYQVWQEAMVTRLQPILKQMKQEYPLWFQPASSGKTGSSPSATTTDTSTDSYWEILKTTVGWNSKGDNDGNGEDDSFDPATDLDNAFDDYVPWDPDNKNAKHAVTDDDGLDNLPEDNEPEDNEPEDNEPEDNEPEDNEPEDEIEN